MRRLAISTACFLAAGAAAPAAAQSTGGVTGPKIAPNDRTIEYRIAYDPQGDRAAQRLHFQQAVSDRLRLRIILVHDHADRDLRFRNVTLQAHYQFQRAARGWNAALQFQGVIPDGNGGPGQARLAWANSLDVAGGGELRLAFYAAREFGDLARTGVLLESRADASMPVGARARVGALSFNEWGSTADFAPLSQQSHRIGPFARFALPGNFFTEASMQIGVTDAAPDAVGRVFVGRSF